MQRAAASDLSDLMCCVSRATRRFMYTAKIDRSAKFETEVKAKGLHCTPITTTKASSC